MAIKHCKCGQTWDTAESRVCLGCGRYPSNSEYARVEAPPASDATPADSAASQISEALSDPHNARVVSLLERLVASSEKTQGYVRGIWAFVMVIAAINAIGSLIT